MQTTFLHEYFIVVRISKKNYVLILLAIILQAPYSQALLNVFKGPNTPPYINYHYRTFVVASMLCAGMDDLSYLAKNKDESIADNSSPCIPILNCKNLLCRFINSFFKSPCILGVKILRNALRLANIGIYVFAAKSMADFLEQEAHLENQAPSRINFLKKTIIACLYVICQNGIYNNWLNLQMLFNYKKRQAVIEVVARQFVRCILPFIIAAKDRRKLLIPPNIYRFLLRKKYKKLRPFGHELEAGQYLVNAQSMDELCTRAYFNDHVFFGSLHTATPEELQTLTLKFADFSIDAENLYHQDYPNYHHHHNQHYPNDPELKKAFLKQPLIEYLKLKAASKIVASGNYYSHSDLPRYAITHLRELCADLGVQFEPPADE
jgi:hypothetical protein